MPGDHREQEADRVASAVVSSATCLPGLATCCGRCPEAARPGSLHGPVATGAAPPGSAGRPLDPQVRSAFGQRLGADFSAVRVHTDPGAQAAARGLGAAAFTVGSDISFADRAYAPATAGGQRLLAHELTHVLQQSGRMGPRTQGVIQRAPDPTAPAPAAGPAPAPDADGFAVRAAPPAAPVEDASAVPPPDMARVWLGDVLVVPDRAFMRGELRRLIAHHGLDGADLWLRMLHGYRPSTVDLPFSAHTRGYGGLRVRSPLDVQREMQQEQVAAGARQLVDEVYAEVRSEAVAFLTRFEDRAKEITRAVLRDSEVRVEAERLRYGVKRWETTRVRYRPTGEGPRVREEEVDVHHDMDTTLSARGLAGAAADLTAKRDETAALVNRQSALLVTKPMGRGVVRVLPESNRAEHERLAGLIETKNREFDVLRAGLEDKYPILAGFADDPGAVARIASGPSSAVAAVLSEQIEDRLARIRKVREELVPGGRAVVWKLPEIVQLTKGATGAVAGTSLGLAHSRMVDDKTRQVQSDEKFTNLALGALAIGLGLLAAIPTGGSSVVAGVAAAAAIGSLAVGIGTAFSHLQQYQLERAMAGTDFDRARAVSAEDPSLFWLAVDILGAMLDVGPALRGTRLLLTSGQKAFTTLAPAVRRAMTSTGERAAVDLAEVRRLAEAVENGGPDLAARVAANVERVRKVGGRIDRVVAAGQEARAVERAAASVGEDVSKGLASASTRLGGHTVTVTPRGRLVRCSVCGEIREEFALELSREPDLARRWFEANDVAAQAAAKGDKAMAQRAADLASGLADDLEAVRRTQSVRLYRGLRVGAVDDILLMDRRLVVDMPFVGKGASDTNAAGWLRDAEYYWKEMLRRHPEAFSDINVQKINGLPPFSGPLSPTNDPTFRAVFPQYDVKGLRGKTLVHHHVGGGGQAAAIPSPLHPGSGGIHVDETAAGITGGENEIADVLQRLLDKTGGGTP